MRLKHFAEYVESTAQGEVRRAEETYESASASMARAVINRSEIDLAISELSSDDHDLAERVVDFLQDALRIQEAVADAAKRAQDFPDRGVSPGLDGELCSTATALRDRARQLQTESPVLEPKAVVELKDLESRVSLNEHLSVTLKEIERQKRVAAYKLCLEDTQTQPITRKSTELTKRLVTDQLRTTFQEELSKLEFNHLAVEIQSAGGTRGALFHRLAFTNAPGVVLTDVLSEGESRTLSLAAFLTGLSTASSKSAIIFDDPVSSLDHIWRARIARRLVAEAKDRQVIVFTHDILFLRLLMDECAKKDVLCDHQYVRREGQAGISSSELPWVAMGVSDRLAKLRNLWQAVEKVFRTSGAGAYETEAREIYALTREAWEQAVSEVLLNDVVEPYRTGVETKKVRVLHDITEGDCRMVEDGMTECSRWMHGHDHPAADGTPFPEPPHLQKRIQDLDEWVREIRRRRQRRS